MNLKELREIHEITPADSVTFQREGLLLAVERGTQNNDMTLIRYTDTAHGWDAKVDTETADSDELLDWLEEHLEPDNGPTTCTRRGALRSRYNKRWPIEVYRRKDGSHYAKLSLVGALSCRWGEEEDGDLSFIDPDGGPYIGYGIQIVTDPQLATVAAVSRITPGDKDAEYILELEPIPC
jgi:hypothetical protein